MDHTVTVDYTRLLGNANVKVFVRARPCADGQYPPEDMFQRNGDSNIVIKDAERMQYGNHAFSFDKVARLLDTYYQKLSRTSKHLIDCVLKGINSCCFAYGQTGSGKTYSIFGESGSKSGLLPRSIEYLFAKPQVKSMEVTLAVSFLEIYCDRVRDLARDYLKKARRQVSYQNSSTTEWFLRQLKNSGSSVGPILGGDKDDDYDYEKANFEIHEDAEGNVFVKDLSIVIVTSREEVDAIIQSGLRLRATYETKMNAMSSRSHTVFTLHIFQHLKDTEEITYGMLNMVDLAGSERLKKSDSDGQRLKEALHINSSLSAVGKVVMSLDPESGYNYIPYRDSKLTRLLQNSIGGNSITMLIATIHPMREHYEECLSTLQFANRCRSVQNQPRVNHINSSVVDKDRRIRKLNEEITSLRRQLGQMRVESSSRLLKALHVLGFDAQEVTEAGEVKFADGSVLHSVFDGVERANLDNHSIKSKVLLSNNRRISGRVPGFHHNDLAKRRQEHLQEKYINAKDNFSALIMETAKEKEKLEKTAAMQRSRIMELENYIEQKQKEFRYALIQERAFLQKEMAQLVANNNQLTKQSLQTKKANSESHRIDSKIDCRAQLTEQIARIEASKQTQIAVLQEQCDQIVNAKKNEVKALQSQIRQLEFSHSSNLEMIRMDCNELFDYIERLVRALQRLRSGQHATIPKNILADVTKLQHIKSLVLLHKHSARKKCWVKEDSGGNNADRPFSAPVRRAKPPGFTSSLRERVRETAC